MPKSRWGIIRTALVKAIAAETKDCSHEELSAILDEIARDADDEIAALLDAPGAARTT